MSDKPKTVPDAPPADQTADIAQSEAYETANVYSGTSPESSPAFGPPLKPDEVGSLGPYRVLRELGRGGMGAVYLGFDERLKRKVALKVMLPKYAAIASSKNRFLREARAAAGITHDHIVTIYEADEHGGTPFMAMQLLQGYPLDVYLKKNPRLPLGELLRIGREMALGLAAAHSVGLIHRDIKPGNVWLEAPNGRVKILDFGLAKPTDEQKLDGELTATGVIVGTPAYMPPEQARGAKADFRADLFSLGVVLYRLATGTMPFNGDTMMAMLAAVIADDPKPIREINPEIPEPLAKLIHQLMEKKPQNRPKSADEVAERLQQIQLGTAAAIALPMQVIPLDALPTATYVPPGADPFADIDATDPLEVVSRPAATRSLPAMPAAAKKPLPKWPLVALGLFLVVLAALIPQIVSIMTPKGTLVIESSDPDVEITVKQGGAVIHDKSKGREFTLRVGDDYTIEMTEKDGLKLNLNKFEITRNGRTTVKVIVQKPPPKPKVEPPPSAIPGATPVVPLAWQGPSPLDALDPATIPDDVKAAWKTGGFDAKDVVGVFGEHRQRHWGAIGAAAFGPDGKTLATVGQDNVVRIWDTGTRLERIVLQSPKNEPLRRRFSRDGRRLLTSDARTVFLWDLENAREIRRWELNERIKALAFSADNNVVVFGMDDSTIRLMDTRTGDQLGLLKSAKGLILNVKISPDGRSVLSQDSESAVRIWDVATSKTAATLPFGIEEFAFSHDGKMAYGTTTTHIHVWDVAKAVKVARHGPVSNETASRVFSADGKYVLFGAAGVALLVDPATGKTIHTIDGHENWVRSLKFSPDGQHVLTGDERGNVRITSIDTGKLVRLFAMGELGKYGLALSPDNKQLAVYSDEGTVRLWDVGTGKETRPLAGPVGAATSVSLSADLSSLVTVGRDAKVRVWNSATGRESANPLETKPHPNNVPRIVALRDGKRILVLEDVPRIRSRITGEMIEELSPNLSLCADITSNGRLLVVGETSGRMVAFDVSQAVAKSPWNYSAHSAQITGVKFSPDGTRLVTCGNDHRAFVWDVTGTAPKKLFELGAGGIPAGDTNAYEAVWSPDGKRVAVARGHGVALWDVGGKTAVARPTLKRPEPDAARIIAIAQHPSLPWLAVADDDGRVTLWNTAEATIVKTWPFPASPTELVFAADGRHLLTANPNGTVYVLRLEAAKPAAPPGPPTITLSGLGNDAPVPASISVPAWHRPGGFAEVKGRGAIEFLRREAGAYALDIDVEVRGDGVLAILLGDGVGFRPELRLKQENGSTIAHLVRVQGGKWFARAGPAKLDVGGTMTLVVTPAGTGLARNGDVLRVSPATANSAVLVEGRAATTEATIRSVRMRKPTKEELGAVTAKLGVPSPPDEAGEDSDPDRRAAEWALGLKGQVAISIAGAEADRLMKTAAELPGGPFALDRVDLPIGAAVSDADVAKLAALTSLRVVVLTGTPVGNEAARQIARISSLTDVHLALTKMDDDGLMKLAELPKLRLLTVANTAVTDRGAVRLGGKASLKDLNLHSTDVGDATAAELAKCPKLATLHLSSTKVTDAGLTALETCSSLRHLTLGKTAVTEAGVKKLAAALPLCKIEWDVGTIEPTAK